MREGIGSPGWARTSDFLINRPFGSNFPLIAGRHQSHLVAHVCVESRGSPWRGRSHAKTT